MKHWTEYYDGALCGDGKKFEVMLGKMPFSTSAFYNRLTTAGSKKKSYLYNLNPVTIYALLQIANPIAKYVLLLYLKPRWHKFYINNTWVLCLEVCAIGR